MDANDNVVGKRCHFCKADGESMKKLEKLVAVAAAVAMGIGFAGCGSGNSADSSKGHVYFMNNKSEIVNQLQDLAQKYTDETGVRVDVQTAASGTYDSTMASELAKSNVQHFGL